MATKRKTKNQNAQPSPLPVWQVSKSGNAKYPLKCKCPRCKNSLLTTKAWAEHLYLVGAVSKNKTWSLGRPCPYCYKASQLPPNAPGAVKPADPGAWQWEPPKH